MLTDRPNMTLAVYWDVKQQINQPTKSICKSIHPRFFPTKTAFVSASYYSFFFGVGGGL
ncbi:MAG: hypothetical protein AB2693_32405 [Candidatus Thiodiazotropha sp.]